MSLVSEQFDQKVKVSVFLTREEFANVEQIAAHMFKEQVLPKATVSAFVKASTYKFYNEYNEMLRRSQNANRQ